ncbi:MAG TPA: thioredoxin-disulfide reductase [Candidatus Babeliales bacterium]|nr:thioredoxin-disulfide reductase [Candidatus Babeliales bacterium]
MDPQNIIIIGSGPAGLTAGIYTARANLHPLIIEGLQPGGQLITTSYVENWPGEEKILGPQLMTKMKKHAQAAGAQCLSETIEKVDFSKKPFKLFTNKGKELSTKSVIIATGATPKKLKIPGEDTYWSRGVSTCAVCDGVFYKNKKVVIVGGGDTAMEEASFMTNLTDKITIVHILDKLTASPVLQKRVLNNSKINIIYNSTVTEIKGNNEHVTHAILTNQQTNEQTAIETDAIFIAIGLTPNTHLYKDYLELTKYGYLSVTNHTHTSIPGIFAAGDVCDSRYRQAISAAGSGCMAALDVQRYLESIT